MEKHRIEQNRIEQNRMEQNRREQEQNIRRPLVGHQAVKAAVLSCYQEVRSVICYACNPVVLFSCQVVRLQQAIGIVVCCQLGPWTGALPLTPRPLRSWGAWASQPATKKTITKTIPKQTPQTPQHRPHLGAHTAPKSTPKPTTRRSKNDLETDTPKT